MGKVTDEDELVIERQKRRQLEAELAYLKDKKPLNYYEVLPGVRIKRWFVVVLLFQVICLSSFHQLEKQRIGYETKTLNVFVGATYNGPKN